MPATGNGDDRRATGADDMNLGWRAAVRSALLAMVMLCSSAWGSEARTTLHVGGTGAALGTMRLLGEAFMRTTPGVDIHVMPYIGSTGAIRGVAEGSIQLGLSARPLGGGEQALPVRVIPYAITPFVFVAHAGVPDDSISRQQVVDIYAGRLQAWSDGSPLRLILRPRRETDNVTLRAWGTDVADALDNALGRRGMRSAATDHDAARDIERTPGALGTSSLALAVSEARHFKILSIDAVKPSLRSLEDGTYPLSKRLYLVVASDALPVVRAFANFVVSPAGAQLLRANGQLPIARGEGR